MMALWMQFCWQSIAEDIFDMPDISMCANQQCPSKDKCYRFRAIPSEHRQSYMAFAPPPRRKTCDDFIRIRTDHRLKPIQS